MAGIYAAKGQDWIRSQVAVVMPVRRQREGERERGKSRKSRPTFSQVVDLEPRHLLGEDGLGQVEQCRVVDGEVTVVLVQDPHGCPLDATEQDVCVRALELTSDLSRHLGVRTHLITRYKSTSHISYRIQNPSCSHTSCYSRG